MGKNAFTARRNRVAHPTLFHQHASDTTDMPPAPERHALMSKQSRAVHMCRPVLTPFTRQTLRLDVHHQLE